MDDPARNLNPNQLFPDIHRGKSCFTPPMNTSSFQSFNAEHLTVKPEQAAPFVGNQATEWDPRAMLSNLSLLEQKIHQVQDIIRSTIDDEGQLSIQPTDLAAKQQLVTADLTCIIIQLISTAGALLPSIKNAIIPGYPPSGQQLGGAVGSSDLGLNGTLQQNEVFPPEEAKVSEYEELIKTFSDGKGEAIEPVPSEDHDMKDSEDGVDGENLPPGSYEVLQLEKEEILAPHTHFCSICGKGFKRDANLRMHMRGHGDEYKSPAALAKPTKEPCSEPVLIKRYSCPFVGCKRNKEHKKFQPLKTILCVKNHYKRSHCDKSYTCSRCNTKKFSVIADLKTHEKHCGRDKWLCSCGTTFSRKDKLFGHVALFQGHTPALPSDEGKSSVTIDQGRRSGATAKTGANFARSMVDSGDVLDSKGVDDDRGYFAPFNFDSYNFGGLDDFTRAAFDASDNSFSFLPSGSCNFVQKSAEDSNQNRLE